MVTQRLSKKIAVLAALAAIVVAATAYAYLTAGGSGTGAGGSSEQLDTSMRLTAESPDIATLPGSDVIDITAENEGSSPQRLSGLTVVAAPKAGIANCPTGSFTVTEITPNNAEVPAGQSAVVGTAKINFVNVTANQNGCLASDSIALTLGS
jgi:invasion protein IalB